MRIMLLCFVVGLVISCSESSNRLGIPEEEMVLILADVHLAEAALQNLRGTLKDSMATVYYNQVYKIHGIKESEFKASMEFLKDNPKVLDRIYLQVLENLSIREAEATKPKSSD